MFRFAPSPTGDMHIGNLRAAIINYICAKKFNQKFILRIEDTDKARNIAGKEEDIKRTLNDFGIFWDEYYVQSQNFHHHRQLCAHLLREGKAFACTCSEAELEAERELASEQKRAYRYSGKCEVNLKAVSRFHGACGCGCGKAEHKELDELEEQIEALCLQLLSGSALNWGGKPCVIRLKKPDEAIKFHDEIKGNLSFEPADIDSFVIMRADCSPTYNFACCCDDICEGVSMIIRGEDHVSNTPKQEHIRASIGVNEQMKYAHLPIILNDERKKMSKRDAASSVAWLLECGYLPSAIANYLLLLGNKTPCEIFTLEQACEFFDIANISKSPASFDQDKLAFINREHLKLLENEQIAKLLFKDEFLAQFKDIAPLGELAKLYLEEASTLSELSAKLAGFFLPFDVVFKNHEEWADNAKILIEIIKSCPEYAQIKELSGLSAKQLFKPLRLLLSAAEKGPELAKIYEICCKIMPELLALKASNV